MRRDGSARWRAATTALAAAAALAAAPAAADGPDTSPPPVARGEAPDTETEAQRLCRLIGDAAEAEGLPPDFFARLIWTESRFDVRAVSPAGAQGVAQFMPATAKERGLADPFDPETAIPASAALLADLRAEFGNLGLAAAAYNAGPDRVDRWRRGRSRLPAETEGYVHQITDRPAAWFLRAGREAEERPLKPGASFEVGCAELPVMRTRAAPRPAWRAVMAGGPSRGAALIAYGRIRERLAAARLGAEPYVQRRGRAGGGALYTVQLGAPTLGQAAAICLRLRAHRVPCMVARN